jgi:hypothetical protein
LTKAISVKEQLRRAEVEKMDEDDIEELMCSDKRST